MMHDTTTLILRPHLEAGGVHLDRFVAELDGEPIVTSRRPLYDGARALLDRGFAPDALLTVLHAGRPYASFQPRRIGELATLTIQESNRAGLRRVTYEPPEAIRSRLQRTQRDGASNLPGQAASAAGDV